MSRNAMDTLIALGAVLVGLLGISFIGLVIFRLFWVTHIDNYEIAFVFDKVTGKVEKIDKQGWVVRTPIRYSVHAIDGRPYQITISANERVLNAKLCRFNPEGLDTFVEWHGRAAGDMRSNLLEIMKCYAFDKEGGKDCPFLEVIDEVAPSQTGSKISKIRKALSN